MTGVQACIPCPCAMCKHSMSYQLCAVQHSSIGSLCLYLDIPGLTDTRSSFAYSLLACSQTKVECMTLQEPFSKHITSVDLICSFVVSEPSLAICLAARVLE